MFCFLREFSSYLSEERLEIQAIADDISSKYVPPHVNVCFYYVHWNFYWVYFYLLVKANFSKVIMFLGFIFNNKLNCTYNKI